VALFKSSASIQLFLVLIFLSVSRSGLSSAPPGLCASPSASDERSKAQLLFAFVLSLVIRILE